MKAKDVIAALEKLDPELPVYIELEKMNICPAEDVIEHGAFITPCKKITRLLFSTEIDFKEKPLSKIALITSFNN